MRVLIACECSNTVRDAFLLRGHDAYSCDIQRADHPNPHYKRHIRGDVRPLLRESWDLIIAHPPCTYLANSGVQWLKKREGRLELMMEGLGFFKECLEANSPRVCVENPIMHGYAKRILGIDPTQIIQPYWFGNPVQKSTCLWLKGLPPLQPTNIVEKGEFLEMKSGKRMHKFHSSNTNRNLELQRRARSRTFPGIANAMAEQWG